MDIRDNRKDDTVAAKRAFLTFALMLSCVFFACLLSQVFIIVPFALGALGAGIYASLLLFADKYSHKRLTLLLAAVAPAAVSLSLILFSLTSGDGDKYYFRVIGSAFCFALGAAVYFATKKGETRSNITIAGAVTAGAVIIACAAAFVYEKYGKLDLPTLKEIYRSSKDAILSYARTTLEAQEEKLAQYGIKDPASYTSAYLAAIKELLDRTLCLLPGLFVCACNILSYICTAASHRIARRVFAVDLLEKSRALRVSVAGALIFVASYLISIAVSFVSDSTTVVGMVCENLYLIYTPALALCSLCTIIRNRRAHPGMRGTLTLVAALIMLVLNFSLGATLLAFFGAINTFGEWLSKKITDKRE